jgi:hypothetical protein
MHINFPFIPCAVLRSFNMENLVPTKLLCKMVVSWLPCLVQIDWSLNKSKANCGS